MSSCTEVPALQLQQDSLPIIFKSRVYSRVALQLWSCLSASHSLLLLSLLFLIIFIEPFYTLLLNSWKGGLGSHKHQCSTELTLLHLWGTCTLHCFYHTIHFHCISLHSQSVSAEDTVYTEAGWLKAYSSWHYYATGVGGLILLSTAKERNMYLVQYLSKAGHLMVCTSMCT